MMTMKKNVFMLVSLWVFCLTIAFSGTLFWDDGEVVKGTKINYALNEKANVADNAYIVLTPQTGFATATAAVGTIYKNANGAMNYLATATTWMVITATTTGLVY